MKDGEIHVGDVLRIREWDDMVSEYGKRDSFRDYGVGILPDIAIPIKRTRFTTHMKKFCGKVFTVSEIYLSGGISVGYKFEDKNDTGINRWFICAEMLEPFVEDKEWEIADDNDIELLLSM